MATGKNTLARIAFGKTLTALRAETGLTQRAAAKAAGVVPSTWMRWEHGEYRPGIDRAPEIARGLGLPIAALYPSTDGSVIIAELRLSAETLAHLRKHGRAATTEVANRIAASLEPRLLQIAQPAAKQKHTRPEARKRKRRPLDELTRQRKRTEAIARAQ